MKVLLALKHLFIPHDKNDFKPHIFRELAVAVILFGSVFLLGSSFGTTFFMRKTVLGVQMSSGVLIDLTNESRLADNQPALIRNPVLDQAAELKGTDMASKQYFSHDSPEGVTPWHWFRKVGYNFLYAGENLAINYTEAGDVERAWMQSPLHRANIMNVQFREIGLAVVEGVYEGYPTMYVVQMFGTPAYGKTTSSTEGDKALVKVAPDTNTPIARSGDVKGEQVLAINSPAKTGEVALLTGTSSNKTLNKEVATTSATELDPIQKIIVTPEIAVVKDSSVSGEKNISSERVVKYSTWYQKIMFNAARYVDVIYKIMATIIALALIVMIFVEIRKQHLVHIIFGVALLLLLLSFMYINTLLL